jgi:hypothetical protein
VRFTIPRDWNHLGLFPVKPDEPHDPWLYPYAPGYSGETWVGSSELGLALRPPRGLPTWHIEIKERILFSNTSSGHPWPLDLWGSRLIEARLSIARRVREGEFSAAVGALIENGLRNILLHGIGSFHRRARPAMKMIYPSEGLRAVPAQILASGEYQVHSDGTITYPEWQPVEKWTERAMHPEFAAQVWDRCRTHVLYSAKKSKGQIIPGSETGALMLPRDAIVAIRTDAIYVTYDPGWPNDGKTPGQFRAKGLINESRKQPEPGAKGQFLLNRLRDESRVALGQQKGEVGR